MSDEMKNQYKVQRCRFHINQKANWYVIDKIKDWRICEVYSKRDAYDIARALNTVKP